MFASHHELDNLVVMIDYNKIQSLDSIENTLGLEPFKSKWESFGWIANDINGHDHNQLKSGLEECHPLNQNQPYISATLQKERVLVLWRILFSGTTGVPGEEFDLALEELQQKNERSFY